MANLTEVQMALKQGEKAKAAQLLKIVLQERPSADAWVMAARMTSNPETAKMHLQRALAFDAKHVKARDMLRDLGGKPMSTSTALTGGLLPVIRMELEKFGANKPVLKNLRPGQRVIVAISLYTAVFVVLIGLLSALLTPPADLPPPPLTTFDTFQGDTLVNQWTTEGLNIKKVENVPQEPEALSKETLNVEIEDAAGTHLVTVFLYPDITGVVMDGHHLTPLAADGKNKLDIFQTAAILYPADLNDVTHSLLVDAFNPAPIAAT